MGLCNRATGFTMPGAGNETRLKGLTPFKPIELELAFNGAYRSYRIAGKPKIDVDTFFYRIRKELIGLIRRELKTKTSARIQMIHGIGLFVMGPLGAWAKPMMTRTRKGLS